MKRTESTLESSPLRLVLLFVAMAMSVCQPTNAQTIATDPTPDAERGPLSVGMYAGALYQGVFVSLFFRPWAIDLSPSYLVAANFDYRFYKSDSLPIQFEAEVDIAKRFNGANQFDFDLAAFVRWTSFPWNKTLYTNVRLGVLGLSYVNGISAWERRSSDNETGSRLLIFVVPEVTFASSGHSRGEAFIRVHHRSGAYGLLNGVYGGSNYLCIGYRIFR